MLCQICLNGLEGLWKPDGTRRLGLYSEWFPPKNAAAVKASTPESPVLYEEEDDDSEEERPEVEKYVYAHHKTRESFLHSCRQGCVMCNRFRPEVDERPLPVNNGKPIPEAEKAGYFSIFTVRLDPIEPFMFVRHGDTAGGFNLVPAEDKTDSPNFRFNLDSSTDGPNTREQVKRWVENCSRHHKHCGSTRTPGVFPSRLLAIRDDGDRRVFRLVKGKNCPSDALYCTLSHCWGSRSPVEKRLRLEQSTLEQLQGDQPVESLPRTFRDAIEVALRFDVKLIWIDSLCIFQDNLQDWRAEAATMQQVYKNSYLSISALGAEDDEGGLFFEREPREVAPTVVHLKTTEDGESKPYRHQFEKGWAWRLSWAKEPITTRGWVVQERLLPARVAHFGRKQVFWECREQSACEIHPDDVYCFRHRPNPKETNSEEEEEKAARHAHLWKQLLDAPDSRDVGDPYTQLFVDWNAILYIYTAAKLTIPTDKLVALSGLAKDMKEALNALRPGPHRYLAGLWEEQLEDDLCWFINGRGTRPSNYRAPSWSFAAIDGPTRFPLFSSDRDYVRLLGECSATTQLLDSDETGQVTGGQLTLTGPLFRVHFGDKCKTGMTADRTTRLVSHASQPDSQDKIDMEPEKILPNGKRWCSARAMFDVVEEMPDEAFCVPIRARHWHGENYSASGIVLLKVDDSDTELYRRIGYLSHDIASKEEVAKFFGVFPRKKVVVV